MRACSNNNMHNLKLKDIGRGYACYYWCMPSFPVLLHIHVYLVSCYACYYCCMPSSPVLLQIYKVSCYIVAYCCFVLHILLLLHVLILHIYCPCFSNFWHSHPYILHCFFLVYLLTNTMHVLAPPFFALATKNHCQQRRAMEMQEQQETCLNQL